MLTSIRNVKLIKMRLFTMFITAVCVLFLIKLRWPKNKSLYVMFFNLPKILGGGSSPTLPLPLLRAMFQQNETTVLWTPKGAKVTQVLTLLVQSAFNQFSRSYHDTPIKR